MTDYQPGHIKRNPDNGAAAVRTSFPEADYPDMAWLVATLSFGALTRRTSDVESWDDIYTPPEGS